MLVDKKPSMRVSCFLRIASFHAVSACAEWSFDVRFGLIGYKTQRLKKNTETILGSYLENGGEHEGGGGGGGTRKEAVVVVH